MFLIFSGMATTLLVILVATLDPLLGPPRLCGWWNLWRAECSHSLGYSVARRGANSSLLVLMIMFDIISKLTNTSFFEGRKCYLRVPFSDSFFKSTSFSSKVRSLFPQRLLTFLHRTFMVNCKLSIDDVNPWLTVSFLHRTFVFSLFDLADCQMFACSAST